MLPIKRSFASLIKRFGLEFRSADYSSYQIPWNVAHACSFLEHSLPPPYYAIQAGAFDGITSDPVGRFLRKTGWRSILFEPHPDNFQKLATALKEHPEITCKRLALGLKPERAKLFCVNPNKSFFSYDAQLASFNRQWIVDHGVPDLDENIISHDVEVTTFSEILDTGEFPRLDLLQIDCEGMDESLVRSFPFHRARPKIINMEMKFMPGKSIRKLMGFLNEKGYWSSVCYPDLLSVDKSLLALRYFVWSLTVRRGWDRVGLRPA